MADLETIRQKLAHYILDNGHTFREISLKMGRKDSYIQQYIRYGFPKRLNEIDRQKVCLILGIDEKELLDDELIHSGLENTLSHPFKNSSELQNLVLIDITSPKTEAELTSSIIGRIAINYKEFSSLYQKNPQHLKIIRLNGDYMSPFLPPDSLVLYDDTQTAYTGDGIYVISFNKLIQVKRLQQSLNGKYLLLSDNPEYQPTSCLLTDFKIIGKALAGIQTRKL